MTIYRVRFSFPNRLTKVCNFPAELFQEFLGISDPKELALYPQNHWGYSCRVVEVFEDTTGLKSSMEDTTLSCLYLAEYVMTNFDEESRKAICKRIYHKIAQDKSFKGYVLNGLNSMEQIEYAIACKKDYLAHIARINKSGSERAISRMKFRKYAQSRQNSYKPERRLARVGGGEK